MNVASQAAPVALRKGEISILLATRGRPESLAESIASLKTTTTRKDKTVLWVYVDEDDAPTREAMADGKIPDPGLTVHWFVGPRTPGLGETHQAMWNASGRASEVYMISSDDARFETPGWDEIIRSKLAEFPDGVMLAFAHDPNTADQATYPILSYGWLNAVGYFFPGYFPYWFDDKWVDEIGRMVGRYFKLPIVISPIRGRGRTQRMRGMPFWVRFFQLTLDERKEAARNLIAAAYANNPAAKDKALAGMEELAAKFAQEEEGFSDLYATFQEERHSALTPEERNRFDLLYFKRETQAVGQLILKAQARIAQGQHADAMKYLDATQLSNIRVRSVQLMKVECLRALGQLAEAERLAAETLAAWPQMDTARRIFRFLGMVANEGKRIIVGLTDKKPGAPGSAK